MRTLTRVSLITGVALTILAGRTAAGQTLDRSVRPVAPPAKPLVFPAIETRTLPNGLRVKIVEDHSLPLIAARVVFAMDSSADPVGKEGLYALTLSMLREGTSSLSGEQISTALGQLGNDVTPIRFTATTNNMTRSLELMADMLMHPTLPADAIERRKATQVAAVQRMLALPSSTTRRILYAKLWGADSPNARAASAGEAGVRAITHDDVARFYDQYFQPQNVTIVLVGDFRAADAMKLVEQTFGAWANRGARFALTLPVPPAAGPTTIYLIDRPNAPQSYVAAGQLGPSRATPDYYALESLGPILGGGTVSRLLQNLRAKHSYMYSGAPSVPVFRPMPQPSMIFGSAAFYTPKTDSAMIQWIYELNAIRGERPPTDAEADNARASFIGNLPAQIETVDRIADRVANFVRNDLPDDYDARLVAGMSKLTAADIGAAARKHLDPAHMVIVIVGDRKLIEAPLRAAKIAPIVIVDENGNPTA